MSKRVIVGVLVIVLAVALAGCKSASEVVGEQIAEEIVGGNVEVDGDQVTIESEGGDVTIQGGDSAELPDGFPSDFPVHRDAKVESASSVSSGGEVSYYVTFVSGDSVKDLYGWYKDALVDGGWAVEGDYLVSSDGQDTAGLTTTKGSSTSVVTIGPGDGGNSLIGVVLTDKG